MRSGKPLPGLLRSLSLLSQQAQGLLEGLGKAIHGLEARFLST